MKIAFLLLLSISKIAAQISGAGQLGCIAAPVTGTGWTTSTSVNTTQVLASNVAGAQVLVMLDQGTTLTVGAIQFLGDPGDGTFINLNSWQVVDPTTPPFAAVSMPYTLQASTNKQFLILMAGMYRLQLKLTTAITGSATITPYTTIACYQLPILNFQATAANFNTTAVGAGSAGSANAGVMSVQGIAAMTKLLVTPDSNVKVNAVGNAGASFDAATGAAPPANGVLFGGIGSGATGGFVIGIAVCDTFANINISTATTTLLVTGVSGRHVRICHIDMVGAAADNVGIISGTGATCGTGSAAIVGTTSATGYNFGANGGMAAGSGIGTIMRTVATGDSVCLITSAATQLSGVVAYTIY